ncbi:E-selectin-like [Anoplophora glabripennis]|uniref:E-selectin-like n=1 Tax=Anoplophora glabripennis TaxID=217634 RepID=UPI000874726D|nr:E-selectin-like [Anoplophora glabripennis]
MSEANMLKFIIHCVLCFIIFNDTSGKPVSNDTELGVYVPLETDVKNNKQYYFGIVYKGNIFQAIQYCNYHNMELLSIETPEENTFLFDTLVNFIGTGRYGFWTSGTLLPENHWVWLSTGKPVVHPSWATAPYNTNKSCIDVNYIKTSKALVWADAKCNDARHVICETRNTKSLD